MANNKEKKPRLDIMLDMETCGIVDTSAILEIALIPFCLEGGEPKDGGWHAVIDMASCYFAGMTFEKNTQEWWVNQSAELKAYHTRDEGMFVNEAIRDLYNWMRPLNEAYEIHLWCRGLNFDIPKLENCFRKFLHLEEMPYPWWCLEDARTYCRAFGIHKTDVPFEGTMHSAYNDCLNQIKLVQMAFNKRQQLMALAEQKN